MELAFKILLILTIISGVTAFVSKLYVQGDTDSLMSVMVNRTKGTNYTTKPLMVFGASIILTIILGVITIIIGIIHYL